MPDVMLDFRRLHAAQMARIEGRTGQDLKYSFDAALQRSSKGKNRYSDILPYDLNRVKLQGTPTRDYINASYVDCGSQRWIAAQGPLDHTIVDFWEMIFQQPSSTIVMLCGVREQHMSKCAEYWPLMPGETREFVDHESERCVRVQCTDKSLDKDSSATVRTLLLEFTGGESSKAPAGTSQRKISHLHFESWPDHDIAAVDKVISLIRLSTRLHLSNKTTQDDLLTVHCSAGCGRTGTFMALSALLDNPQRDVFELVNDLRKQRIFSVQSLSQYQLLRDFVDRQSGER